MYTLLNQYKKNNLNTRLSAQLFHVVFQAHRNYCSIEETFTTGDKLKNHFVCNHFNRKPIPASSFQWMKLYSVNCNLVWFSPTKIREVMYKMIFPCNICEPGP